MCRVLNVHRSGFYAWSKQPLSKSAQDNERLLERIKESYVQSGLFMAVLGSRMILGDKVKGVV